MSVGRLNEINSELAMAVRSLEALVDRVDGSTSGCDVGREKVEPREPQTLAELLDQRVNTTAVLVQLLHRQIERANTIA